MLGAFLTTLVGTPASASVYSQIYSFPNRPDGSSPHAKLVQAADGTFYGTTANGGISGGGVLFKMDSAGATQILYDFSTVSYPDSLILGADGLLYGTAYTGGTYGVGAIFRIDTKGKNFKMLYAFSGGTDGSYPVAL